jgi:hypothetical protein
LVSTIASPDVPDRAQRIAALQSLLKQLYELSTWLRKDPRSAKAVLSAGFMPLLGLLLSPYGMERRLGSIGWGVDERSAVRSLRHGPRLTPTRTAAKDKSLQL